MLIKSIPRDLYHCIIAYLPERVLLNRTFRQEFLGVRSAHCEKISRLGLRIKRMKGRRQKLVSDHKTMKRKFQHNIESDDPIVSWDIDNAQTLLTQQEEYINDLRSMICRLNKSYTKERRVFLQRFQN